MYSLFITIQLCTLCLLPYSNVPCLLSFINVPCVYYLTVMCPVVITILYVPFIYYYTVMYPLFTTIKQYTLFIPYSNIPCVYYLTVIYFVYTIQKCTVCLILNSNIPCLYHTVVYCVCIFIQFLPCNNMSCFYYHRVMYFVFNYHTVKNVPCVYLTTL